MQYIVTQPICGKNCADQNNNLFERKIFVEFALNLIDITFTFLCLFVYSVSRICHLSILSKNKSDPGLHNVSIIQPFCILFSRFAIF